MIKPALIVLLLCSGCTYYRDDNAVTRAEVDASNAETACKAAARNLVQIARCEPRRR